MSPRYSPWYTDGELYGGFDPNVTFLHHPSMMYAGSPGYLPSPPLRRSPTFGTKSMLGMSNEMDDIITTGSASAAASPGFLSAPGEDFPTGSIGGIDFGGGTGTEGVEGGGDESQAAGGE